VEIGSRALGLSESQTLGDVFYRKRRLLRQTGGQSQLRRFALLTGPDRVEVNIVLSTV